MKYIVYLTTNVSNNKIYVGVHKTEDSSVFDGYIGCGVNIMNPHSYNRAKAPFHFAVIKYGVKSFKRITLKEFDSYEEALELEASIVTEDFVKRKDTYNVALGGGMPPITNKIIYQYSLEGDYIKEWFSIKEAEDTLNFAGNVLSNAVYFKTTSGGFLWADYKVDKLDTSEFTVYSPNKNVYMYDMYGKYKDTFTSITHAAKELNTTTSNIQRAIKGSYKIQGSYFSLEFLPEFKEPEKITTRNTNIHQYDLKGIYVKSYNNISEVCKDFGNGATSGVLASIRLGRAYKDFQWSTSKVDCMKELIPDRPKSRKVGQYDKDNNLIEIFNTVTACREKFGSSVNRVLKNQVEYAKGFKFKYLD